MDVMQTKEIISALADGQLQGEAFAYGVEIAASDALAREAWHTYHLIGDVLRSGEFTAGTVPAEFLSGLQNRLQKERWTSDGPQVRLDSEGSAARKSSRHLAANDDSFGWKLLAGLASLTAIGAIGWTIASGITDKIHQEQLAGAQARATVAETERGVMVRDARLDELLAAHRQLGGASALPMPVGFVRGAPFEGASR